MNTQKHINISCPGEMILEHCRITGFLRNIFAHAQGSKKDADVSINCRLADARAEMELMAPHIPDELSYSHLEALEQSVTDAEFRYVFVYRDKRPVLFLYFQVFTVTSQNFKLDIKGSFVKNIVHLFLDMKRARVLVAGNAMRNGQAAYCYDSRVLRAADALDAQLAVADRLAGSDNATAIILGLQEEANVHDRNVMEHMGYATPWADTVMEMDVDKDWLTLQDYINDLSRKYKARANKILAGMEGIDIQPMSLTAINKHIKDLERLFGQVVDKQPFTLSRSGVSYIKAMKELYGDDFEITAYFKEMQLIGFRTGIVSDEAYEVYYVGFDTKLNNEYPLYFHMLLAGLERAIALRKSKLKLGRTSFDAKASLGAKPVNTGYYINLRHVPDMATTWFTRYFSSAEDNKWKQRNPLKSKEPVA